MAQFGETDLWCDPNISRSDYTLESKVRYFTETKTQNPLQYSPNFPRLTMSPLNPSRIPQRGIHFGKSPQK